MQGIVRVAAAVPHLHLGNVAANVEAHLEKLREAQKAGASLVIFPELSLTGYTCGDLFFQQTLISDAADESFARPRFALIPLRAWDASKRAFASIVSPAS